MRNGFFIFRQANKIFIPTSIFMILNVGFNNMTLFFYSKTKGRL